MEVAREELVMGEYHEEGTNYTLKEYLLKQKLIISTKKRV